MSETTLATLETLSAGKWVVDVAEVNKMTELSIKTRETAKALSVTDDATYELAGKSVAEIKALNKNVTEYFKPIKDEANKVVKDIREYEKQASEPLAIAESDLKGKMATYQQEQARKAREAEEKAREAQRQAAQALLEKAVEAENNGDSLTAELMQELAVSAESNKMPIQTVQTAIPKVDGVSIRKNWKAKVVDASLVPIEINGMMIRPIDESVLNKLASASKGQMKIDGVEFYSIDTIIVKGAS